MPICVFRTGERGREVGGESGGVFMRILRDNGDIGEGDLALARVVGGEDGMDEIGGVAVIGVMGVLKRDATRGGLGGVDGLRILAFEFVALTLTLLLVLRAAARTFRRHAETESSCSSSLPSYSSA